MTRFDFGTWLLLMHYASCWERERSPACLVIFVPNSHVPAQLAKFICPKVKIIAFNNLFSRAIFAIFRRELVQLRTLNLIYAEACFHWPHALFIFDMAYNKKKQENVSCYIPTFDPALRDWPFSSDFLSAYLKMQKQNDNRNFIYQDMIKLFYHRMATSPKKPIKTDEDTKLLETLKINAPYVVMNLNCKKYQSHAANSRSISNFNRYNALIDFLISKGYNVVMQGRNEQANLTPRKGFIEYFKSPCTSCENDYRLFSQCAFAIVPKTGPEVFGPICNIPILGLDYVELSTINPKGKCRFFPKHVWDTKMKKFVHWKDLLKRPCFFNVGKFFFEEGIKYYELEEEELIQATEEFLHLLPQPFSAWLEYTPLQKEFKQSLHPAHIDLYNIVEVPCEAYLTSPKYK